ncbi:MAG: glutaminyl-peptide cyclotransferase [Smithellaceae bacterium]|nr:glutaminyl-peptide cyclotransferase [Smithellaceae bacterium]
MTSIKTIILTASALLLETLLLVAVAAAGDNVPVYRYQIVNVFPHDPAAFTQGLIYRDGYLFESTGLKGRSSLRKVKLETGEILQRRNVDARYFAEGLTDWRGKLLQLTWQENTGFIYDESSFEPMGTFSYAGEGWGLTQDGKRIVVSDGSAYLRFLDPKTLQETGRLRVTAVGRSVPKLNELEYVRGKVYANIWKTDLIAVISPESGQVEAWIDLTGLLPASDRIGRLIDVLNGIAYDPASDRLFVTGKLWPKLFEIRIVPQR